MHQIRKFYFKVKQNDDSKNYRVYNGNNFILILKYLKCTVVFLIPVVIYSHLATTLAFAAI